MKSILFLLLICSISGSLHAQKKSKGKDKNANTNYDSLGTAPVTTKSSKKDDKKDKKGKNTKTTSVNYTPEREIPVPDTAKKFTGVIKYRITSDDPSDQDSVFIVFGENRILVKMFIPGYRADQVFETDMIANMGDNTFSEYDSRTKTYKVETLGARNDSVEFTLTPDKKTGKVMNFICDEEAGEMTTPEGDVYEAACLISKQHYFNFTTDYIFQNIQPLVRGYRIVLGFRTKSSENENTYIMAYKVEPGNTDPWFDLKGYRPAK